MSLPSLPLLSDPNPGTSGRESSDDLELHHSRSSSVSGRQLERDEHQTKPTSGVGGLARHTLGLILLLFVVFLWTTSNFLGSVSRRAPQLESDTDSNTPDYFRGQDLCETVLSHLPQHRRLHSYSHSSLYSIRIPKLA